MADASQAFWLNQVASQYNFYTGERSLAHRNTERSHSGLVRCLGKAVGWATGLKGSNPFLSANIDKMLELGHSIIEAESR